MFRDWIAGMKPTNSFVRDWNVDELVPALTRVRQGRSFASGRSAFRETGCNQCHRLAGDGGTIGPDLTGVAQRLSSSDLLEAILLPSKKITDGFATCEIETRDGEVINGRVEHETDRVLIVRQTAGTDPPMEIRKADVRRREMSKISNMPTGLLNSLD